MVCISARAEAAWSGTADSIMQQIRQLPDTEIQKRMGNILPLLQKATEKKMAEGGG